MEKNMDKFIKKISEIYELILSSKDSIYKIIAIDECKDYLGIQRNDTFGNYYYSLTGTNKNTGTVYTPIDIAEYIIENTIKSEDIISNPFIKILDPSCGIGNILIPCFIYLKQLFIDNLQEINIKNDLHLKEEEIAFHIVENNLFGIDIDRIALNILQIDLFYISKSIKVKNYVSEDFLLYDDKKDFNVYIGNPPYVGHKSIEREYREKISALYKSVYRDKGDLAYCFFDKAIKGIKSQGKVSFITSRYFLESLSGEGLRSTILKNCSINKIVDFYGIRPFKAAGIDPVIIFLEENLESKEQIQIIKGKNMKTKEKGMSRTNKINSFHEIYFDSFMINKSHLGSEPWIIIEEEKRTILEKVINASQGSLSDICESYQGIISGCDKAFIIDYKDEQLFGIEKELLRPWIKSSHILKGEVRMTDEAIIYSNDIKDQEAYPYAIKHIEEYKDKLTKRRECISGGRRWYELQWGRKKEVFEDAKIIFPYKANCNRFALDKGSYFSADVYALKLKENCNFSYDFLVKLLNSKIYEFYFKSFAKKLGGDLYEYYPNNLMRLRLPLQFTNENIDDDFLYNYFNIDDKEKSIIEASIK
jgi:adenine-specific DNA-methyltransferase